MERVRKGRVLLVEPESPIRLSVQNVLEMDGYDVVDVPSCRTALESLQRLRPDVVILPANPPDGDALEFLSKVKGFDPGIPCVLLTRREDLDIAASAIQAGAEQFLTKPVQIPTLLLVVDRVLENARNRRRRLRDDARTARVKADPFQGSSAAVRNLAERAKRVLGASAPVLIHGETGTGKGVLASWLHSNGPRADECFLDLNCAGLSPEFLESELFGHERGAFTGAVAAKVGLFEVAHRGTLFLDEIGDMPLTVQPKLLKVLEEKRFRRLGDVREKQVDVRLIAASHEDLVSLVESRRFRGDLYFRINTVVLDIPPLRERVEDVAPLAASFLGEIAADLARGPMTLSPAALSRLEAHAWPGNLRELRNALERAALLSPKIELGPEDFVFEPPRYGGDSEDGDLSLLETEKRMIRKALEAERGRVERAAEALGISRSSLYQKIRKYRIPVSRS